MSLDLALGDDGDLIIDEETGDFKIAEDLDQRKQALRIALGTNEAELSWNRDFGLDQLDLFDLLGDEETLATTLTDYLDDQYDDFRTLTITSIEKQDRSAFINLDIEFEGDSTSNVKIGVSDDATDE